MIPSILAASAWMTASAVLERGRERGRPPVAGERGVEHLTQPMQDHRLVGLRQHTGVNGLVVGRACRDSGQRAARHQHDPPARLLHGGELFEVGGNDVVERTGFPGIEVVGADAGDDAFPLGRCRSGERTFDQLLSGGPIEARAALGRVHRLRDSESEVQNVATEGQRRVPVDRRAEARLLRSERVGHDVHRREGRAVEPVRTGRGLDRPGLQRVGGQAAGRAGEIYGEGGHRVTCALDQIRPRTWSAPFSATMIVGALVLPLVRNGIADESMMRRPSRPCTFSAGSTTAMSSVPILQVPTGW